MVIGFNYQTHVRVDSPLQRVLIMKIKLTLFIAIIVIVGILSNVFAQDNKQVGLPDGAIARYGKGGINTMQFSPDGTQLAVGTSIGVWIYDVQDGKEKSLYLGHFDEIRTLAFSPDGKFLAVNGFQNAIIQLWDMNTDLNKPILTFNDKPARLIEMIFSEDGKTLFGLSDLGYLGEWDIETGNRLSTTRFGKRGLLTAFAPYGNTFVCGDPDNNEIRLWDSANETLGEVFKEKQNPNVGNTLSRILGGNQNNRKGPIGIETLAISPDSKTIASSHIGNIIKIWDVTTREQRFSLKGHKELISTFTFSSDSQILASGSTDNNIMLWDVSNGQLITTLSGHKNSIETLAFSPTEATLLASGSTDGTVRFWDTKTGKEKSIFATGHTEAIEAVAFNTTDTILSNAASNGTVQIWNVQTGEKLPSPKLPHYDTTKALALSKDATLYACHGANTIVKSEGLSLTTRLDSLKETRLWSLPIGEELNIFQNEFLALTFSPDNKTFAAVTPFETVEIWNINSGKRQHSFEIEHSFTYKLVFSNNGKYLAKIDRNHRKTHLWDITTRQEIVTTFNEDFWTFAFSPDSTTIAMQVSSGIIFWRITSTGLVKQKKIESMQGYCSELIYSPDGNYLLRAYPYKGQGEIMILDVDTGIVLGNLSGNMLEVKSLVFSHNSKILASVSHDDTILLWDWEKIMKKVGQQK